MAARGGPRDSGTLPEDTEAAQEVAGTATPRDPAVGTYSWSGH